MNTILNTLKMQIVVLPLMAAVLGAGCSSIAPGNDPVVVNAERTTRLALETFDLFVKWEYDNRAVLAKVPEIRQAADQIRRDGPSWLSSARVLTRAYKDSRTAENKADLETALVVLRAALERARLYLEGGRELVGQPPIPPG